MKTVVAWLLVLIVVSIAILPHSFVDAKQTKAAKKAESKIKDAGDKALGKNQEYDGVCKAQFQLKNGQILNYYTIPCVVQPPPPPTCKPDQHLENGVCVPNPPPNPPPVGDVSKVCLVGDLSGSTAPNMMKDCNLKIGLGDLGYASDLSYFKSLNFNKCVIGNHDSPEDGSNAIYQEALAYCGNQWSLTLNPSTLILGFNTNGDIPSQLKAASSVLSSHSGLKTVIVVSHKNGHVFPNAHHIAEAKTLYSQLEAIVPAGVKLYEISGHNHNNAAAPAKNWYIAGAGGKSFYPCGKDDDWTFCDNTHVGYLELTISNKDGATAAKFIK